MAFPLLSNHIEIGQENSIKVNLKQLVLKNELNQKKVYKDAVLGVNFEIE